MAMTDPVAVYTASSNAEAHLLCNALTSSGVEAAVVEDVSLAGVWLGGLNSDIHKPKIMVARADADRVVPLIEAYERRAAERRAERENGPPVEVVCEECGHTATFPAAQNGTVQNCPACYAHVDVGDQVPFEGWDEVPPEDEAGEQRDDG